MTSVSPSAALFYTRSQGRYAQPSADVEVSLDPGTAAGKDDGPSRSLWGEGGKNHMPVGHGLQKAPMGVLLTYCSSANARPAKDTREPSNLPRDAVTEPHRRGEKGMLR